MRSARCRLRRTPRATVLRRIAEELPAPRLHTITEGWKGSVSVNSATRVFLSSHIERTAAPLVRHGTVNGEDASPALIGTAEASSSFIDDFFTDGAPRLLRSRTPRFPDEASNASFVLPSLTDSRERRSGRSLLRRADRPAEGCRLPVRR